MGVDLEAVVDGKIRQRLSGKQMEVPRERQGSPVAPKHVTSGCVEIGGLEKQNAAGCEMVRYPSQYVSGVYHVFDNLDADYGVKPCLGIYILNRALKKNYFALHQ